MFAKSLIDFYGLKKDQWKSRSEIEKIQRRRLKRTIRHAYNTVPYYQRLFHEAGIKPDDIKTADDLEKIPVTTRRVYQDLPPEAVVSGGTDLSTCKKILTSGSSGMPLTVIIRKEDSAFYDMVWARASVECGQRLLDKVVAFKFHVTPDTRWFQKVGIWRKHLSSLLEDPQKQVDFLRRIKPDIIKCSPAQLVTLSLFMKERGIKDVNVRLIFTRGACLDPLSRELIEGAFGSKIYDCYGTTEFGLIAWECLNREGYHINADTHVLEIVREDGSRANRKERGRIVCTSLNSFAMPFIRHDTGDIGILSDTDCSCGRGLLPLLARIEGKMDDFFIHRNGEMISPSVVINQVKSVPGVSQYRIVQEDLCSIEVQLVKGKDFAAGGPDELRGILHKLFGYDINITIDIVGAIPREKSGKWRPMISKVKRK